MALPAIPPERNRILFVAEDPVLLARLRETMADMAAEWDMAFVDSGPRALEAFARAPFDAVVSGLGMKGMSGAQLLQQIMVRHPATIRFALADGQAWGTLGEMVGRTHQFIADPWDPATLKSILRKTFRLGGQLQSGHAKELVARIGRLPSLPAIYQEINDLLESERGTVENLGATLGKDLAMTAMVLKMANSAFFSHRHTLTDPAEAVSVLGIDFLRSLVLAHGLFTQAGAFRYPTFGLAHLWRHSLAVAFAARHLAELQGEGPSGAAGFFTAGLLHDVGILVLASRFPQDYPQVLRVLAQDGALDLETAESQALGASHGEVGAYLLDLWGLPPAIVQAAAWHHQPRFQDVHAFTPALAVHVADSLLSQDPEHVIFSTTTLDEPYLASLGLLENLPTWRAGLETAAAEARETT